MAFGRRRHSRWLLVAPVSCFELSKRQEVNRQRVVDALRMLEQPGQSRPAIYRLLRAVGAAVDPIF